MRSIGTEANTSDVQVAIRWKTGVLEVTDLLTRLDIKDLCGTVTTSRDMLSVAAETDTADDARVGQVMNQLYVENTWYFWVEDGIPVITFALEVGRQVFQGELDKSVANIWYVSMVRCWMGVMLSWWWSWTWDSW